MNAYESRLARKKRSRRDRMDLSKYESIRNELLEAFIDDQTQENVSVEEDQKRFYRSLNYIATAAGYLAARERRLNEDIALTATQAQDLLTNASVWMDEWEQPYPGDRLDYLAIALTDVFNIYWSEGFTPYHGDGNDQELAEYVAKLELTPDDLDEPDAED